MGLASVARGNGGFQFERPERRDPRQRLQCTGFVILSEVPKEESVISVEGDSGVRMAGGAWNSPRRILPHFLAPASPR